MLPVINQGATIEFYTDRKACTIVYVSKSGRKVIVREDRSVRIDQNGMSECQNYQYEPDPNGIEHTFYRDSEGNYGSRRSGKTLYIGTRDTYHDYSF